MQGHGATKRSYLATSLTLQAVAILRRCFGTDYK